MWVGVSVILYNVISVFTPLKPHLSPSASWQMRKKPVITNTWGSSLSSTARGRSPHDHIWDIIQIYNVIKCTQIYWRYFNWGCGFWWNDRFEFLSCKLEYVKISNTVHSQLYFPVGHNGSPPFGLLYLTGLIQCFFYSLQAHKPDSILNRTRDNTLGDSPLSFLSVLTLAEVSHFYIIDTLIPLLLIAFHIKGHYNRANKILWLRPQDMIYDMQW